MRSGFHQGQKRVCFNKRPDICTQLSFVAWSNSILAKRGGPYMSPEFLVGSQAAFLLDVIPDLGLVVAAVVASGLLFSPRSEMQ